MIKNFQSIGNDVDIEDTKIIPYSHLFTNFELINIYKESNIIFGNSYTSYSSSESRYFNIK